MKVDVKSNDPGFINFVCPSFGWTVMKYVGSLGSIVPPHSWMMANCSLIP